MSPVFRHRRMDPKLTPEQREARIAELRARRRARLRWLAMRSALVGGVLGVLLVVAGWWLLTTLGGREFLMAQIKARLPANAELSWQRAEGPVSGPLTLHGVHFSMPRQRDPECVPSDTASCAMGTMVFDAQRVTIDPAILPLLGRTLRLDALQIEDAVLKLPRSDTPFELPRWPDVLPQIAPPLAIDAADVKVDDLRVLTETEVENQYEPMIAIERLRGGLAASDGELHIKHMRIASNRGRFAIHGDYLPGDNYRMDLTVTAVMPQPGVRLGLVARGDLDALKVGIAGNVPESLRATLELRGAEQPRWSLLLDADGLDPALLADPEAEAEASESLLTLELRAEGVGGRAKLQGKVQRGEFTATILPSQLSLENQVLQVQPLALALLDGRVTVRGRADFNAPENASFRFAVNARGLRWGGEAATAGAAATPAIETNAAFGLAGTMQQWAAIGDAALARGDDDAQLAFDVRGDAEGALLKTLHVQMPTGSLDATGNVAWAPALGWDIEATLAGFDPGYFAAGWDGAVNGKLASTGRTRDDGGLEIEAQLADLGGQLRGRALDGQGQFAMHGAAPTGGTTRYGGEVELSLGDSRIEAQGKVGDTLDVDVRFAPLQLADLLPDASGTLSGTLALDGRLQAPDIAADLSGSDLRYGDYHVESLSLRGELPWSRGNGALALRATGVDAGIVLESVALDARGAVESLALDLDAQGDIGTLSLSGDVERKGNIWAGTLAALQLAPTQGAQWQLQQPTAYSFNPNGPRGSMESLCLASSVGGSLCMSADWPQQGISVQGEKLPLALVQPYLPEAEPGRDWLLRGEIAIDAQLRPESNGWRGFANVSSASGGLRFSEGAEQELLRYNDLQLRSTFQQQGLDAQLSMTINDDGRLQASVATGWEPTAPLNGEVSLNLDELTWLELFSPDIVAPSGRLSGNIVLGGTREAPTIGGQAQLKDFSTEIPSLAIILREGNVQLSAQPDGSARISGSVATTSASGESAAGGRLQVDGSLGWRGQDVPVLIAISGERVLVADTPELHAVISPDIEVRIAAQEPTAVTGTVVIPEATINLERLDSAVAVSPDVVVLDPIDPDTSGMATGLALDLTLVLGEDVNLAGFGLDASLEGRLRIRGEPGQQLLALGNLDIDGEYQAYGQDLTVTRGRLSWSNDPVADPVIDLTAVRKVGAVTAGVTVSGRASAPVAEVWTDPASSQSEALAYLTLGRPLSSLTGAERGQVSAASAALTAGGNYLAGKLGAKLGLDEAGVMQSRTAGSVFGVGKQLSPRLYVGYGVSLLGTGTVLTLKYLLDHGFDIEIESSTVENRALLNWRKEK